MEKAIRDTVSSYFMAHADVFLALFEAIAENSEILRSVDFSLAVEKSYDCFPALPLLLGQTDARIFGDEAPENLERALSSISHLPSLFDEVTLDPEAWDIELDDGAMVPVAIFVRDLLAASMRRLIPGKNQVPIRIGVQGSTHKVNISKV